MHGKTAKILAMNEAGATLGQIAEKLGCTKSNASQTIKRHREWNRVVAPIPKDHHEWIVAQAQKKRMMPMLFVAQLLVSVIDKEMKRGE
jgi:predicted transcriptional regulator